MHHFDLSHGHNQATGLCAGGSGESGLNSSHSEVQVGTSRSSSEEKIVSIASPFFIQRSDPSSQLEQSSLIVTEDDITEEQHLNSSQQPLQSSLEIDASSIQHITSSFQPMLAVSISHQSSGLVLDCYGSLSNETACEQPVWPITNQKRPRRERRRTHLFRHGRKRRPTRLDTQTHKQSVLVSDASMQTVQTGAWCEQCWLSQQKFQQNLSDQRHQHEQLANTVKEKDAENNYLRIQIKGLQKQLQRVSNAGQRSSKIIETIESSLLEAERGAETQIINAEEDYFSQSAIVDESSISEVPLTRDNFKSPPRVIDSFETSQKLHHQQFQEHIGHPEEPRQAIPQATMFEFEEVPLAEQSGQRPTIFSERVRHQRNHSRNQTSLLKYTTPRQEINKLRTNRESKRAMRHSVDLYKKERDFLREKTGMILKENQVPLDHYFYPAVRNHSSASRSGSRSTRKMLNSFNGSINVGLIPKQTQVHKNLLSSVLNGAQNLQQCQPRQALTLNTTPFRGHRKNSSTMIGNQQVLASFLNPRQDHTRGQRSRSGAHKRQTSHASNTSTSQTEIVRARREAIFEAKQARIRDQISQREERRQSNSQRRQ